MIKFNKKISQTFLSPEWCNKLISSGIEMSDSYYFYIVRKSPIGINYYIVTKEELDLNPKRDQEPIPTYTLSELLYKLNEYPAENVEEGILSTLYMIKDAPFYGFGYEVKSESSCLHPDRYFRWSEYPINAAASLLLYCHNNNISYNPNIYDKM